jgi:hypothetical protein
MGAYEAYIALKMRGHRRATPTSTELELKADEPPDPPDYIEELDDELEQLEEPKELEELQEEPKEKEVIGAANVDAMKEALDPETKKAMFVIEQLYEELRSRRLVAEETNAEHPVYAFRVRAP